MYARDAENLWYQVERRLGRQAIRVLVSEHYHIHLGDYMGQPGDSRYEDQGNDGVCMASTSSETMRLTARRWRPGGPEPG